MAATQTRAVLVGIEEYGAGLEPLDGPAPDACRFVRRLLAHGVPTDRIHLLVSPLERNRAEVDSLGLAVLPADRSTVDHVLHDVVRGGSADELLFVHWGGHGVVDADDTRRLFYADADKANARNLHLDGYLRSLRTDHFPQNRQLIIVDACQTFAARWRGTRSLPTELPPFGAQRAGHDQYVLFAAGPGEAAMNVNSRRTGMFSEAVLAELAKLPDGVWPPDPAALTAAVAQRFTALRSEGRTRQAPTYLWYREPRGEQRIQQPAPPGGTTHLDLAATRAIASALLDIDELLDPVVRRHLLLFLPRDIAVSVAAAENARQQVVNWIRTCARFAHGREALLDALAMIAPTETAEFRRAAEVIAGHWPAA